MIMTTQTICMMTMVTMTLYSSMKWCILFGGRIHLNGTIPHLPELSIHAHLKEQLETRKKNEVCTPGQVNMVKGFCCLNQFFVIRF